MNCCNNNCNQGRDCPARATTACTGKRCDQLGVCHCPPAVPVTHPRTPRITDCQPADVWDHIWFWAVVFVAGCCTVLVTFGVAGWLITHHNLATLTPTTPSTTPATMFTEVKPIASFIA